MADWNAIFKREGRFFKRPQEDMVRVARELKKAGAKRVLDLGCGTGRHMIFLAKRGFDVVGMDISPKGLSLARAWLKGSGLRAKLVKGSCYDPFPFTDSSFDAVISVQVIHHAFHADIERCIAEMRRVIRPGGLLFVSVPDNHVRRDASRFKRPEPRVYIPQDGLEAGVPHYIYNKTLLRRDFKSFRILDIHEDSDEHFCLLANKPADV